MTSSYWESNRARGVLQPGGAGFNLQDLGTQTTIAAFSGSGKSYESDFSYDGYVGSRATSNEERTTLNIMGRRTIVSPLRQYTRRDCLLNLHVLYGCADAPTYGNFESGIIFIDGGVTSRSVDQNLAQGMENFDPKTLDQVDLTFGTYVEVRPAVHLDISKTTFTEDLKKVIAINRANCPGACGPDNDGNQEFIAVGDPISPATVATVLYTDDGGNTWSTDTITGAANVTAINAVTIAGDYVLFGLTGTNGGVYYASLADVKAGTVVGTLANGIANGTSVTALFAVSPKVVFAGISTGALWKSTDGGFSFTEIAAAGAVSSTAWATIHGRTPDRVYFGGVGGELAVYSNQSVVSSLTDPTGGADILTVHVPAGQNRASELFVGDDEGDIWHSTDGGVTFTVQAFPDAGTGRIEDIQSAGVNSIGLFIVQTNAGATGSRVLRDLTGGSLGANAIVLGSFTSPSNTTIASIAPSDPNTAVTVGDIDSTNAFIGKVQAV